MVEVCWFCVWVERGNKFEVSFSLVDQQCNITKSFSISISQFLHHPRNEASWVGAVGHNQVSILFESNFELMSRIEPHFDDTIQWFPIGSLGDLFKDPIQTRFISSPSFYQLTSSCFLTIIILWKFDRCRLSIDID